MTYSKDLIGKRIGQKIGMLKVLSMKVGRGVDILLQV